MKSLYIEFLEGRLCEKGLLKERYDESKKDLVREITPKGDEFVRTLFKEDPVARKILLLAIKNTLKTLPPELRKDFLEETAKRLK